MPAARERGDRPLESIQPANIVFLGVLGHSSRARLALHWRRTHDQQGKTIFTHRPCPPGSSARFATR